MSLSEDLEPENKVFRGFLMTNYVNVDIEVY
jgi:hypothetical protein